MDRVLDFLNKWISPFTVTAVIGFIIWLAQHNFAILNQETRISALEQNIMHIQNDDHSMALLISRTTAVQESLTRQLRILEERMTRNESWISDNKIHKHTGQK